MKRHVHLFAVLLLGCGKDDGPNDELGDEESSDGDSEEATADGGTQDATADEVGDADATDDATSGGDTGSDCELGEYISGVWTNPSIDWSQASGSIGHVVSRGVFDSGHYVSAIFITGAGVDDSLLCVEWLVGDANVDIDECNVYYTQGFGLGGEWPAPGFENLAVDAATFDVGEGPVALEVAPGDQFNPTYYSGGFSPPPSGVPFGGTAALAVNFADLSDLDLTLDVPEDLMPIGPAYGSMMLSSVELASWTWSNPGGSEPVEIEIDIGATPFGSGWGELVRIHCNVTDDGEFAFPSEWFDLARERLGPDIAAGATITRRIQGQLPLAGAQLHWKSSNDVWLGLAIVD